MERLICKRNDGGISIITSNNADRTRLIQDAENLKESHGFISWRWMKEDSFPKDSEFRDAWCDETSELIVDVDLSKAKEIMLNEMRMKRKPKLEALDKEFIIALERGDDLTDIRLRKQKLRDITDQLKSLIANGYNDQNIINQIKKLGTLED